jgi:hypothetical protein
MATTFTTLLSPATPSIASPTASATDVSRNPTITSSAFSSSESLSHTSSTWQLATDSGFSSVVWSKAADTSNKTSIVVNATNGTFAGDLSGKTKLGSSTEYYVRVKYTDSEGSDSAYSTGISFTTIPPSIFKNAVDVQSPYDPDLFESAQKAGQCPIFEEIPTVEIPGIIYGICLEDDLFYWWSNGAWHH